VKRRYVTEAVIKLMRSLEAQGLSRKEIADRLDLDPATVTRHLGAVRQYRGLRMANG
jgi:DNA-binding CsgD family transcriptional regulator